MDIEAERISDSSSGGSDGWDIPDIKITVSSDKEEDYYYVIVFNNGELLNDLKMYQLVNSTPENITLKVKRSDMMNVLTKGYNFRVCKTLEEANEMVKKFASPKQQVDDWINNAVDMTPPVPSISELAVCKHCHKMYRDHRNNETHEFEMDTSGIAYKRLPTEDGIPHLKQPFQVVYEEKDPNESRRYNPFENSVNPFNDAIEKHAMITEVFPGNTFFSSNEEGFESPETMENQVKDRKRKLRKLNDMFGIKDNSGRERDVFQLNDPQKDLEKKLETRALDDGPAPNDTNCGLGMTYVVPQSVRQTENIEVKRSEEDGKIIIELVNNNQGSLKQYNAYFEIYSVNGERFVFINESCIIRMSELLDISNVFDYMPNKTENRVNQYVEPERNNVYIELKSGKTFEIKGITISLFNRFVQLLDSFTKKDEDKDIKEYENMFKLLRDLMRSQNLKPKVPSFT